MDETDIVQILIVRADAGDLHCAQAAAEIQRLRRMVGERDNSAKRAAKFKQTYRALTPHMRVRTNGLPFHEKVKARVVEDEITGCWVWQGSCCFNGYGRLRRGPGGKPAFCHRIMYEHHYGRIPEGMLVMHTCDNRRCVNPDHLRLGTARDNMRDMLQKGRSTSNLLTEKDVREIHALNENGVSVHALAVQFCVGPTTIYDILSGRAWAWIKEQIAQ